MNLRDQPAYVKVGMRTNKLATDFGDDKPTSGYQLQWILNGSLFGCWNDGLPLPMPLIAAETVLPLVNDLVAVAENPISLAQACVYC